MSLTFSQVLNEASAIEQRAISFDRAGNVAEAITCYESAVIKLNQALSLCPLNHPDAEPIQEHVSEIQNRVRYLSVAVPGRPLISLESHISPVQLSVSSPISKSSTMGAAAAIGGVGGLLLLGPLGLVAGAAGAAYATTRSGTVGTATRGVAQGSVAMVEKAGELDREHHITAKARELTSAAVSKASAFDQEYHVTDRVKAATSETARVLSDFNTKYQVTDKVSSGISSGIATISNWFQPAAPAPHQQYQDF